MTIISSGAILLKELQKIVSKYVAERICLETLTDAQESFSGLKQLRFSGKNVNVTLYSSTIFHVI